MVGDFNFKSFIIMAGQAKIKMAPPAFLLLADEREEGQQARKNHQQKQPKKEGYPLLDMHHKKIVLTPFYYCSC